MCTIKDYNLNRIQVIVYEKKLCVHIHRVLISFPTYGNTSISLQ